MTVELVDAIASFVKLGGPVVAILIVLSVFALALILLKFAQFWRERVGRHRRAERALHAWFHDGYGNARAIAETDRSPVGTALATAMRLAAMRQASRQAVEDDVSRLSLTRLHDLQRGFRALDAIAQIAPLLGLFGTVIGMIDAFRQLQTAGNAVDPSLLAGGIWVALLTTATGLAVAMPVQLILTWFETQLENERVAIETMTGAVLSHRPPEAAVEQPDTAGAVHAH
ncbi:MotA/TolQ/ExbB proton channel family protein [Nitratireductor luteus]|uniref:MotA/TolQ/ExbB proton channel family protein n=1 Tax=Nitratireductor luteus TaxID=2976980 RepID=UPI00223FEE99|nr:MotA/TolQ/ExbB proton channel family protein [Nitratireductor luteus]